MKTIMMHQSQRSTLGSLNRLLTLSSSSEYGFFLYELHSQRYINMWAAKTGLQENALTLGI